MLFKSIQNRQGGGLRSIYYLDAPKHINASLIYYAVQNGVSDIERDGYKFLKKMKAVMDHKQVSNVTVSVRERPDIISYDPLGRLFKLNLMVRST